MKKLMKVLPVVMVVCLALTSVFAGPLSTGGALSTDFTDLDGGTASTNVTNVALNIWSTVVTIVRILAVAAVVFAGVRYMFASADQKADIKKSMGILAIGAALVFGATYLLQLVGTITQQITE